MTKSQYLQWKKRGQKAIMKRAVETVCLNMLVIAVIAFVCICYSIVN